MKTKKPSWLRAQKPHQTYKCACGQRHAIAFQCRKGAA